MGKSAALGLKLLWTMGCPPTKVNTQDHTLLPLPENTRTHSQTHSYTHTDTDIHTSYSVPRLQGVLFVRISDFWKWISRPFLNGRLSFSCFWFSWSYPCILCSYIPAPTTYWPLSHTPRFGGHVYCLFSLNLKPFLLLLVHPVSNSLSFKSTRRSQPELDVGTFSTEGLF